MISSYCPTCVICKKRGEYTSRNVPPHTLAHADGWRMRGKGMICGPCYRKEHGLGGDPNEPKKPDPIQKLRQAINDRISRSL